MERKEEERGRRRRKRKRKMGKGKGERQRVAAPAAGCRQDSSITKTSVIGRLYLPRFYLSYFLPSYLFISAPFSIVQLKCFLKPRFYDSNG